MKIIVLSIIYLILVSFKKKINLSKNEILILKISIYKILYKIYKNHVYYGINLTNKILSHSIKHHLILYGNLCDICNCNVKKRICYEIWNRRFNAREKFTPKKKPVQDKICSRSKKQLKRNLTGINVEIVCTLGSVAVKIRKHLERF